MITDCFTAVLSLSKPFVYQAMLEKKQAALVTVDPSFKLELHWLVGLVGCDGEARLQETFRGNVRVGSIDMMEARGEEA